MTTLRVEHAVSDFAVWRRAFDGFADARANAGVRSFVIRRPIDDQNYLMLDLEFDDVEAAQRFAGFLREKVWASPETSPALAGAPQTRILDVVDQT